MYLTSVSISGFRNFHSDFTLHLNPGLTVLLGENGSGKSAIIDAIRIILAEDEYSRSGISSKDFFKKISEEATSKGSESINIRAEFGGLKEDVQPLFLPWLHAEDLSKAILNLQIENKEDQRGRFKRHIWGGDSSSSIFEWELLNSIACTYLPPLRDAENQLRAFKGSRLSRLLRNFKKIDASTGRTKLEIEVEKFNKTLIDDDSIKPANASIKKYLKDALGSTFGQDTLLQFSSQSFEKIVERLRLLFYPKISTKTEIGHFRELEENSLGYNNIIYLATVLAELEALDKSMLRILLIEEPEAHLHPQLQIRLLSYIQKQAEKDGFQVIVTSHSPTVAASTSLDKIQVFTPGTDDQNPRACRLQDVGLTQESSFFLQRWLDITKSTLLFAKGIILVEGIAEALVIPELARIVIQEKYTAAADGQTPERLEDLGISVINMNGIFFGHFMQLFKGYLMNDDGEALKTDSISIKCSGITDCDPGEGVKPTSTSKCPCNNSAVAGIKEIETNSINCRLFSNLKTFEYDLAMEGENLKVLCGVYATFLKTDGPLKKKALEYTKVDWSLKSDTEKAETANWLLEHISKLKGEYAQTLAFQLQKDLSGITVPAYIKEAINWVI